MQGDLMIGLKSRFCCILILLFALPCAATESNEVIVTGRDHGRRMIERGGNSTLVRPVEETQFDINTQFKLDPSVSAIDQAKPSAGGFSLPLFRGNDARSSHIFLDDVELQDPFTGFPLMDDIDLRAFGELRIHRGLAPWNVPVASPGGVVQFLSRRVMNSGGEGGLIAGDVFGLSGWGEYQFSADPWQSRTYVRRQTTKGEYSFYSDNGTIRNSDDDLLRRRSNNDRAANMGSSSLRFEGAKTEAELFVWGQTANQGMPIRLAQGDGSARLASETTAISGRLRHEILNQTYLGFSAQQLATAREFSDASQDISRVPSRRFSTKTVQGAVYLEQESEDETWAWIVQLKRSAVNVRLSSDQSESYRPHADQSQIYAGAKWDALSWLQFEWKLDESVTGGDSSSVLAKNYGVTSLVHRNNWSGWIQGAKLERQPSLFERNGNGAEFMGNETLTHEFGSFYEVGLRRRNLEWQQWRGERSLTLWAEDLHDRIRALPISTTTWKSNNMGLERYRGIELREKWFSLKSVVDLEAGVSLTDARSEREKILPRVPLWQGVIGAGLKIVPEEWTLRTVSRYQGRTYDDEENTLEIGDIWVHDLSLDRYLEDSWWAFGVSVLNLADLKSVPVRDVVTGQNDGRIAWESRQREPLPGRQYVIRFTAKF